MTLNSNTRILYFSVKDICTDRLFSAEGSNILFEIINKKLMTEYNSTNIEIHIDFKDVYLVSTSFIGRLQEHISQTKTNESISKIRLLSLRPEIRKQF
mgnify:CR=1 FL=1